MLSERADRVPGIGPSTHAAIQHYRDHGRPPEAGGNTNGAVMRALPVGWFVPVDDTDTVAALVGGLLGAQSADTVHALPWYADVLLPDPADITQLADGLASARVAATGRPR